MSKTGIRSEKLLNALLRNGQLSKQDLLEVYGGITSLLQAYLSDPSIPIPRETIKQFAQQTASALGHSNTTGLSISELLSLCQQLNVKNPKPLVL